MASGFSCLALWLVAAAGVGPFGLLRLGFLLVVESMAVICWGPATLMDFFGLSALWAWAGVLVASLLAVGVYWGPYSAWVRGRRAEAGSIHGGSRWPGHFVYTLATTGSCRGPSWPMPSRDSHLIQSADLFGPYGVDALMEKLRPRRLKAREELCHKGDHGTQLYLILSGHLKASVTSREGNDMTFAVMGPGEAIGELAILGAGIRTATITAMETCELLVLDQRDFDTVIRQNGDLAMKLLKTLARRVSRLSESMEDTYFLNLPARLAKKLAGLASLLGETVPTA